MKHNRRSRRRFLRGALATGAVVSLGLPTLESLVFGGASARAGAPTIPTRYLTWFWGNGIIPAAWVPADTGPAWTASPMLAPLATAALRPYLSIVTNAEVRTEAMPHSGGAAGILTGSGLVHPEGDNGTVAAPSIDQQIAAMIEPSAGGLRSLELGVANHGSGASGTVYNYISHSGPDAPNAYERDPRAVFARLFGTSDTVDPYQTFRGSVLDAVLDDAATLSSSVSATDRARLDQHFTSIRELEARIASAGVTCTPPMAPGPLVTDAVVNSEHGPGQNFTMLNDTMSELLAMALACDQTRVASYMYTGPAAFTRYWEVEGTLRVNEFGMPEAVHGLAHGGVVSLASLQLCLTESMRHFARTLEILRATPESDGTNLLHHCAILGTSCTSFGPTHSHDEYPIVVAGLAGGALRGGTHHRFASPQNASRIPLTLARAVGAPMTSFGTGAGYTDSAVSELLA